MRISDTLRKKVVAAVSDHFGMVQVMLFGSRVDDGKRGGDYDIAIDSQFELVEFNHRKARFLAQLIREGYDVPIDLVQISSVGDLLRAEIQRNSICLNRSV